MRAPVYAKVRQNVWTVGSKAAAALIKELRSRGVRYLRFPHWSKSINGYAALRCEHIGQ